MLLDRSGKEGPEVSLVVQGDERRLAPQSELALFRILQKAWSNIRRQARAGRADFTFAYEHDSLHVTITDDGVGFVPPAEADAPDGHWGLRGMRERAELTGGTFDVSSEPGKEARLHLHIPYPGEDDRDPVCGMAVEPDAIGAEHAGKLYRFCSSACRELFLAQPTQYTVSGANFPTVRPMRKVRTIELAFRSRKRAASGDFNKPTILA